MAVEHVHLLARIVVGEVDRDPDALAAVRATLAARRQGPGLFDMAGFARDFDAAIRSVAPRRTPPA